MQVTILSESSGEEGKGTEFSLPLSEAVLAAHFHLKNIFLVTLDGEVILPSNTSASASAVNDSSYFAIGEGVTHLIVMGTPCKTPHRKPNDHRHHHHHDHHLHNDITHQDDVNHDDDFEEVSAASTSEESPMTSGLSGMKGLLHEVVTRGWWLVTSSSPTVSALGDYLWSAGRGHVAHYWGRVQAACATVRNPFSNQYSLKEQLQIARIHHAYFSLILHKPPPPQIRLLFPSSSSSSSSSSPSSLSFSLTSPPPVLPSPSSTGKAAPESEAGTGATLTEESMARLDSSFSMSSFGESSPEEELAAKSTTPLGGGAATTTGIRAPPAGDSPAESPSSRYLPLWLRMDANYLRPFTTASQRNFTLERWKPSLFKGPLTALFLEGITKICDYQSERFGRTTGGGHLDDPTNLALEELKEWLVTLSGTLPSDQTLQQLRDRQFYLEELHSSDLFQPGYLSQATMKNTLIELTSLLKERIIPGFEKEVEALKKMDKAQELERVRREKEREEEEHSREVQRQEFIMNSMREHLQELQEQIKLSQQEKEAMFVNHKQLAEQLTQLQDEKWQLAADLSHTKEAQADFATKVRELEEQNERVAEEAKAKELSHEEIVRKMNSLKAQFEEMSMKFECKICFEQKEGLVSLVPCGHVFCDDCATRQKEENQCAVCRGSVTSIIHVYL